MKINYRKAKSICYGKIRTKSQIKYLVFHYTGGSKDTAKNNADFFATGIQRSAGAHYFVDSKEVWQSINDLLVAYSVGGTWGGKKITNTNSISIEMCSFTKWNQKTAELASELGAMLVKKYGIPASNIIRHWDVGSKANGGSAQKSCPLPCIGNNNANWNKLKKMTLDKAHISTVSSQKPIVASKPTLKLGAKGETVKNLQTKLNAKGYKCGTPDGAFGAKTLAAVKAFQKAKKLVADGVVGPKTWDALG